MLDPAAIQILDYFQLKEIVERFNSKVIQSEDYEMADIINSVFKQVEINYYGIYFRIGFAKYDGITVSDQIRQYHLQSHRNIRDMHYIQIYEYYLSHDLQKQIKTRWYYKKTVNNLCSELNICEDIEKMIIRFL